MLSIQRPHKLNLFCCLFIAGCVSQPQTIPVPGATIQDILPDNSLAPEMVIIPAGSFIMGSPTTEKMRFMNESPQHRVTISSAFAIAKYETTFADYDKYVEATGAVKPSDRGWGTKYWGRGKMPLFNVNWHAAKKYVAWLSENTGHRYRLPTEAEWEYAARAGSNTPYHTGECIDTEQANYHGGNLQEGCNNTGLYRGKTIATGLLQANSWGLHDIHGNILEWTEDCWHENYEGAPGNGQAWTDESTIGASCKHRVLRGGSWSGRPRDIRSASRAKNQGDFKSIFIGFRVVREL